MKYSLKKAFLSFLAIFCNSAFNWIYFSLPPLLFASLLSSAICEASADNHFAFLHFFSFGMSLVAPPLQCYKPLSIVLQLLGPADLIPRIYLSPPLYYCKVLDVGICEWLKGFPYFLQFKLDFAMRSTQSEAQDISRSCFCWLYRTYPSLQQGIELIWFWYWPSGDVHV